MTDAVLPVKVFEGSWEHTFVTGGVAALAGLMFGLDIGVISGALQFIGDTFHTSDVAKEWIVSSMMFGAAAGALGAGVLSFRLGANESRFGVVAVEHDLHFRRLADARSRIHFSQSGFSKILKIDPKKNRP